MMMATEHIIEVCALLPASGRLSPSSACWLLVVRACAAGSFSFPARRQSPLRGHCPALPQWPWTKQVSNLQSAHRRSRLHLALSFSRDLLRRGGSQLPSVTRSRGRECREIELDPDTFVLKAERNRWRTSHCLRDPALLVHSGQLPSAFLKETHEQYLGGTRAVRASSGAPIENTGLECPPWPSAPKATWVSG